MLFETKVPMLGRWEVLAPALVRSCARTGFHTWNPNVYRTLPTLGGGLERHPCRHKHDNWYENQNVLEMQHVLTFEFIK